MKLYDAANRAGDPVCWSLVTGREYLSSQREKDGEEDVQGTALDKVEVSHGVCFDQNSSRVCGMGISTVGGTGSTSGEHFRGSSSAISSFPDLASMYKIG
ncbi:hypothetical protein E2P81_ATG10807 [Venturia nashicola]|nr:hypothetical protein E2P81_ATG10807 [Venturia nashicola]